MPTNTKSNSIQTGFASSCSCNPFSRRSTFENWFELTRKSVTEAGKWEILFFRRLRLVNCVRLNKTHGNCRKWFSCRSRILKFISCLTLSPNSVKWFLDNDSHFKFNRPPIFSPTLDILFPSSDSLSSWHKLLSSLGKLLLLSPICANHSSFRYFRFNTAGGRHPSLL